MRLLSQVLAAGETAAFGITGDYFRLHKANYACDVTFFRRGLPIDQVLGMEAGTWMRLAGGFDRVDVKTATGQTVKVIIGSGEGGVDRILGEVAVINGEAARVEADKAFIGFVTQAAAAGVYSIAQLHNPAGSVKACWLSKITLRTTATSDFNLYSHNTPLAGLYGAGVSKRIRAAAPASVAQLRMQQNVSPLGTMLMQIAVPTAQESRDFPFQEPIKIEPGYSIMVMPGAVNVPIYTSFQWTEEPV